MLAASYIVKGRVARGASASAFNSIRFASYITSILRSCEASPVAVKRHDTRDIYSRITKDCFG